ALQTGKDTCLHVQLDCMRVGTEESSSMVRVAMSDITDRKVAEADLHRFESQLRDVQKMESLGTLAGGIAHDFNNILGAILGNIELALADLEPRHPVQASLREIQQASLRARDLVRQILTFSRRRPQQLENIALKPIVEE